jgi:hypothetical protein
MTTLSPIPAAEPMLNGRKQQWTAKDIVSDILPLKVSRLSHDYINRKLTDLHYSKEELTLRRMLWLRHGDRKDHYLYGDDGEMQCNTCRIDFMRMTVDEITDRFKEIALDMYKKQNKKSRPKCAKSIGTCRTNGNECDGDNEECEGRIP